jgi:hypothetical protein
MIRAISAGQGIDTKIFLDFLKSHRHVFISKMDLQDIKACISTLEQFRDRDESEIISFYGLVLLLILIIFRSAFTIAYFLPLSFPIKYWHPTHHRIKKRSPLDHATNLD